MTSTLVRETPAPVMAPMHRKTKVRPYSVFRVVALTVIVAILLRGIDALKTFDILYATKGKGGGSFHEVETLNVYAYGLSFDYNKYGESSAVLIVFFMLIIGCIWLLTARRKKGNS